MRLCHAGEQLGFSSGAHGHQIGPHRMPLGTGAVTGRAAFAKNQPASSLRTGHGQGRLERGHGVGAGGFLRETSQRSQRYGGARMGLKASGGGRGDVRRVDFTPLHRRQQRLGALRALGQQRHRDRPIFSPIAFPGLENPFGHGRVIQSPQGLEGRCTNTGRARHQQSAQRFNDLTRTPHREQLHRLDAI